MITLRDIKASRGNPVAPPMTDARVTGADSPLPPDKGYGHLRFLLVSLDVAGAFVAWLLAQELVGHRPHGEAVGTAAILAVITLIPLAAQHLYQARACAVRSVELTGLARSAVVAALAAIALTRFALLGGDLSTAVVGATGAFLLTVSLRSAYSGWLRTCHARGLYCRPVCVYGTNEEAESLVNLLESQPELGYRVKAVLGDPEEWGLRDTTIRAVVPGPNPAVAARCAGASGVVVAVTAVGSQRLDQIVRMLIEGGLHVQMSTGLARIGHHRMRPCPVSHQLLYYVERPKLAGPQRGLKRAIDIVLTAVILPFAAPVLIASAIAIKLDDGGPIFYRQERVGYKAKTFRVIKLRTMVTDASAKLAELTALNERNGPLFKLGRDPRVTRVGRLLRATSIDELPQLFNVLKGEMSLVGPRPALPSEMEQFDAELRDRAAVPPGITGLWQVVARDNPSFHVYRRLDLYYVDNWSIAMDLTILVSTFMVVLGRGLRTVRGGAEVVTHHPEGRDPQPVAVAIDPSLSATSAHPFRVLD
jgi:exopolysaccharide biosynthesis polyprenyl glycosylphosphotransferase